MKTRGVLTLFVLFYSVIMTTLICILHKQYSVETVSDYEQSIVRNSSISRRDNGHVQTLVTKKNKDEKLRWYGPGENGKKVKLTGINISFPGLSERNKKYGFSTFISDMISLHRKMPDLRNIQCKTRVYPDNLPPISIVVIFRDEWWSIVLRTVYSILEMSPPELIYEVIVVDDGSTDEELIIKVKLHIQNLDKIRFIQNKVPRGLMMARQIGIDAVESDLFIVMDGHMEVGPGWLEPLIHRLVQQPKSLLCSLVGTITQEQFEYTTLKEFDRKFPFFDHNALEQMFATYKKEFRTQRNKSVEPIPYGTIQGMMMVMRKDFFQQLGGFDPGMEVWGSEQIELSIKVWMCGGVVEMVPCSTVAHMYRQTPWSSTKDKNDFISRNKARMTQVWMDPPFNENINHYLRDKNYTLGNLTSRHRIRELNRCKPYQYFIDKVKSFSDVYIPTNVKYRGIIQNEKFDACLWASIINAKLEQYACPSVVWQNQFFIFTETNQIRGILDTLVDVEWNDDEMTVVLRHSSSVYSSPTMEWTYDGRRLMHTKTNMCLTALTANTLGLKPCIDSRSQSWKWGNVKSY